jgi:hypothetical protein
MGCGSVVDNSRDAGGNGDRIDAASGAGADADTSAAPQLEVLFPARTWPGSPVHLTVEVLGSNFTTATRLIWDAGEDEVELTPVESRKAASRWR